MSRFLLLIVCICLSQWAMAQRLLHVQGAEVNRRLPCNGAADCHSLLDKTVTAYRNRGYALASADSVWQNGDTLKVRLFLGPRLNQQVVLEGQPRTITAPDQVPQQIDQFLKAKERQGLPFSSLTLDSLPLRADSLQFIFGSKAGPLILWDTVRNAGTSPIKPVVLGRMAGIVPGQAYNHRVFTTAASRLASVPFLQLGGSPALTFSQDRAVATFVANQRPANVVNGVVGFLPNEEKQGRLLLTGQFQLELYNLLRSGKVLKANWQRIKANTQLIELNYQHPVLLGTQINVEGYFYLLREDTLFLTRRARLALSLPAGGFGRVGVSFNQQGGSGQSRQAAGAGTFTGNMFGLFFQFNNLNDPYIPRRGGTVFAEVQGGNKNITAVNNQAEQQLLQRNTAQLQAQLRASYYGWGGRRWQYVPGLQAGLQYNPVLLLQNEAWRLGGLASIRGFNENFFFASRYAVLTQELRFYAEDDAWLFLLADQGYVFNQVPGQYLEDRPGGVGAGISFTTRAGQFQFSYAVGHSRSQGFLLSAAKIHFGLTNRF